MEFGKKKKSHKKVKKLKRQLKKEKITCRPPCVNMSDWNENFQAEMGWIGPFTQEVYIDPVVASDGYTYERNALERCLSRGNCRGVNGENIRRPYYSNTSLRNQLRHVYENSPQYTQAREGNRNMNQMVQNRYDSDDSSSSSDDVYEGQAPTDDEESDDDYRDDYHYYAAGNFVDWREEPGAMRNLVGFGKHLCKAKTKKGKRCKHKAQRGRKYCGHH